MAYRHNAGSGTGEILKWGLLAVAGYFIYQNFFATPAAAATTPPATKPPATPPATPAFNSLAAIYARIAGAVPAGAVFTADQWNLYLAQQSSVTPPDPAAVFTFTDATPRTATMTLAHYWSFMEPYLATQGMSGLGLYRGMGRFYRRPR